MTSLLLGEGEPTEPIFVKTLHEVVAFCVRSCDEVISHKSLNIGGGDVIIAMFVNSDKGLVGREIRHFCEHLSMDLHLLFSSG